jgi:hypothetical protein
MKKRLILIAAALAVVATIAGAAWWFSRPVWPEFTDAQNNEPQAVLKVDRDYAHHIGDLIVVDLFVSQPKDTFVDSKTLSITGDFELSSAPEIKTKQDENGTVTYRFRLQVQTFKVKPEHKLEGSIGWRANDKRHDLTLPALSIFWSNTYDGRKSLMEGDDPRVPVLWYTLRHAVPLALSSLLFLALTAVALVNLIKLLMKPKPVDQARVRTAELIELVRSGRCTKAQHLELDGLVRARYKIGPVPVAKLDSPLLSEQVVQFLRENEPAIYAEDVLNGEAQQRLFALGAQLLESWK